jgi:hypothetical protein
LESDLDSEEDNNKKLVDQTYVNRIVAMEIKKRMGRHGREVTMHVNGKVTKSVLCPDDSDSDGDNNDLFCKWEIELESRDVENENWTTEEVNVGIELYESLHKEFQDKIQRAEGSHSSKKKKENNRRR